MPIRAQLFTVIPAMPDRVRFAERSPRDEPAAGSACQEAKLPAYPVRIVAAR